MDSKEWFNLRQLYRARFSAASSKMDSRRTLARCKKGVRMCCGRVGGVVGVVGAALILLGLTQVLAGVYFMLVLPVFQLGSNMWTGVWSGMCGLVLVVIGWKQKTMKHGQVVLMATLSVLVADVANLVILQVGENGVFLTENDMQIIVKNNLDSYLRIAFWLTTVVTALGIVVSFFGAQYLFCVVIRGPKVKGRMPITRSLSEEGLHHRQVQTTRFQSPCLTSVSNVACDDLTIRGGGADGESMVHGFSGDGVGSHSSSNGVVSGGGGAPQEPATPEDSVPYFLRNHRSAWQFILPEVVQELRESHRFSVHDAPSRTSTLSRVSKSSFQPARNTQWETHAPGGDLRRVSGAPSSCNTSVYSLTDSCRQHSSSPRLQRPTVAPPAPPTTTTLRALATGGWESCAIIHYPPQAGGGFVVDLD